MTDRPTKLYAICLVKNEDDVISQTLVHAAKYCDQILVIDNGSTDCTWQIVQKLSEADPRVVPFLQTTQPYDEGLRWYAYDAYHKDLSERDWWLILDGDEFLAEDPRPLIAEAIAEQADIINAWQIQFYYTDKDYETSKMAQERGDLPIYSRRRYYRIDWQEPRLFRNQQKLNVVFTQSKLLQTTTPWGKSVRRQKGKVSSRRILNRHYQYRDPAQIEKRLKLRYGRPEFTAQVKSLDWRSVMRPAADLTYYRDGDRWHFGLSGLAHYYSGWLRYVVVSRMRRAERWAAGLVGVLR